MEGLFEDDPDWLEQLTAATSDTTLPAAPRCSEDENQQKPTEPSSSSSAVPAAAPSTATATASATAAATASSTADSMLTTAKGDEGLDEDADLLAPMLKTLDDDEGTIESASAATGEERSASIAAGRKKADVVDLLKNNKNRRRCGLDAPEAPQRAKSAYTLFAESLVKDGYIGNAKAIASKWRSLTSGEHDKFVELAASDKARYQDDVKTYFGNKGQDLMSVMMQCSMDTGPSKRQREESSDQPVAPQKKAARNAADDALADLFDMGDDDDNDFGAAVQPAEVQAPQLRLDATGKIIVDAASLQATTANAQRGTATNSSSAMPFEQAYKRTKRIKWTEEEDARFWKAVAAYGSDLLLIQTLFRDKTSQQIKLKYKAEEKRNRAKMDEHLYGSSRSTFTRDLFESQFGKIDSAKHFVPPAEDDDWILAVADKPASAEKKALVPETVPASVVTPAPQVAEEEKDAQFDALLDLFD